MSPMEGGSGVARGDREALFSVARTDRGRTFPLTDPLDIGRCCHEGAPSCGPIGVDSRSFMTDCGVWWFWFSVTVRVESGVSRLRGKSLVGEMDLERSNGKSAHVLGS